MGRISEKIKSMFCVHSPSKEYDIIYRKGFKEFFRGYNEGVERVRKMQEKSNGHDIEEG